MCSKFEYSSFKIFEKVLTEIFNVNRLNSSEKKNKNSEPDPVL